MAGMNVETASANLTKALVDLVGAIKGGDAPVAAARGPGRPPKADKGPSLEDCKAIAEQVREKKGTPTAVQLIKAHGAEKLAGLDKSKYPAFIAACQVALNAEEEEEEEEQGDDSL